VEYAEATRFSDREVTDSLLEDSAGTGVEPRILAEREVEGEAAG
jgi:hypothetical protein